jgi:hypothetical protein
MFYHSFHKDQQLLFGKVNPEVLLVGVVPLDHLAHVRKYGSFFIIC